MKKRIIGSVALTLLGSATLASAALTGGTFSIRKTSVLPGGSVGACAFQSESSAGEFEGQVHTGGTFTLVGGFLGPSESIPALSNDCNLNGLDDSLDIANGASLDANTNGTPDECESGTDLIIRQLPEAAECAFCCDVQSDACNSIAQSIAADFVLTGSADINRMKAWGIFGGDSMPDDDAFTIRIFANNAGLPTGVPLATLTGIVPIAQQTQDIEFCSTVIELTFHFPQITLPAGIYHVELFEQTNNPGMSFAWSTGILDPINGIMGFSADNANAPASSWLRITQLDMAYELTAFVAPPPQGFGDSDVLGSMLISDPLAETTSIQVSMMNTGDEAWTAADGYSLQVVRDTCGLFATDRIELSPTASVPPGESYTFTVTIPVGYVADNCILNFQMFKESEGNFGDRAELVTGVNSVLKWQFYD